jgi:hypothetical protein
MLIVTVLLGRFIHLHELQENAIFLKLWEPLVLFLNGLDLELGHIHVTEGVLGILWLIYCPAIFLSNYQFLDEVVWGHAFMLVLRLRDAGPVHRSGVWTHMGVASVLVLIILVCLVLLLQGFSAPLRALEEPYV